MRLDDELATGQALADIVVGLAGEIRAVTGIPRRLAEAARLGFVKAVVPAGSLGGDPTPPGIQVIEVSDIRQAVNLGFPARTR